MTPTKILVVDDEPDIEPLVTQHFRRQIRGGSLSFRFARDGREALDVLAADREIGVVLSDINMPVMDGLTLLSEIAAQALPVRAIIVSAYGDMGNIRIAMNRGAFDFLVKPIDMTDLDLTIRKTLDEIERVAAMRRERDEAQRMRSNLARYFSPKIVDILAARNEPLGPIRRQDVAVLFSDIVGFTGLAEGLAPERIMEILRDYHARMSAVIFDCGGTLEKFIGDALMATFGVPDPSADDAPNALRCAFAMRQALRDWNHDRAALGEAPIEMGIGVHFGPVVLGDLGGEHGMAFTVIGDTVNTASRLQDMTRSLGAPIVASEAVVGIARASADPAMGGLLGRLKPAGDHPVRGRAGTVTVWTASDLPSA